MFLRCCISRRHEHAYYTFFSYFAMLDIYMGKRGRNGLGIVVFLTLGGVRDTGKSPLFFALN